MEALRNKLKQNKQNLKVFILAGGLGSRLKDAVPILPKVLAPISGRPFLFWQLDFLYSSGVRDVVLMLGHKSNDVLANISSVSVENKWPGLAVKTCVESSPLGTGGAIINALRVLNHSEDFVVINGDTWLNGDIVPLYNAEPNTVGLVKVDDISRFGEVRVENGRVVKFNEKSGDRTSGFVNAGIYKFSAKIFSNFDFFPLSLEHVVLQHLVKRQELSSLFLNIDFIDMGVPEDYARLNEILR